MESPPKRVSVTFCAVLAEKTPVGTVFIASAVPHLARSMAPTPGPDLLICLSVPPTAPTDRSTDIGSCGCSRPPGIRGSGGRDEYGPYPGSCSPCTAQKSDAHP